ncbi:hypothetical protein PY365_32830 [Roseiarcaceae bacterium H3SJ34-1]|uniref:hypothetical protein n=1 Tax=Terripilifer ovatus TaxID=3032367 RepID=UPI003AB9A753|nr:hypothetical protein [Roseiarcaceae bacterium H3SJ34-1]
MDSPIPPIVLPLAAVLIAWAAVRGPANAGESKSFVIAAQDGYGVSECIAARTDCGRVVADAWCEGHGLGKATAYGSADDVTGSTDVKLAASAPPRGSVIITCGE